MGTEARSYLYRGKVLSVEARESVNHTIYGTHFTDSKGYRRLLLLNDELITRRTREEAQADLNAFAERRGLKEVNAKGSKDSGKKKSPSSAN
ncbi:hypothetical protein [Cloacibacillus evryensis]|jgi:hypothetical protein|uniref:Uncharacterized protein n=1 Tax=Cloacibacillus evryensis TaxID=508460 RepID=A0AAW5K7E0_9BACT|nr:hypothetical protein [Cloacibacillus evryensis]EHL68436.1 hypothetical protein HMPREF1006_02459 [Synergistes sp. 3_1_syn1]MCQ4814222.1 hypothetical protein [Cloacibacillus evryensis]